MEEHPDILPSRSTAACHMLPKAAASETAPSQMFRTHKPWSWHVWCLRYTASDAPGEWGLWDGEGDLKPYTNLQNSGTSAPCRGEGEQSVHASCVLRTPPLKRCPSPSQPLLLNRQGAHPPQKSVGQPHAKFWLGVCCGGMVCTHFKNLHIVFNLCTQFLTQLSLCSGCRFG